MLLWSPVEGSFLPTETLPSGGGGLAGKEMAMHLGEEKFGRCSRTPPGGINSSQQPLWSNWPACGAPCVGLAFSVMQVFFVSPLSSKVAPLLFLSVTPVRTLWFTRLDNGVIVTLLCCGFSFWSESSGVKYVFQGRLPHKSQQSKHTPLC